MFSLRDSRWFVISCLLIIAVYGIPSINALDTDFIMSDVVSDASIAADITSKALTDVKNLLRQSYNRSMTQLEVTNHIDYIMRSEGSDGPLSYPTVLMAHDEWSKPYGGSNDDDEHIVDPIHEPVMVVKAGAKYNGQSCDVGRTFLFSSATQEMKDAYISVLKTEKQIIQAIAPGASVASLNAIFEAGLINYTHRPDVICSYYWGHGLGAFTLEDPILSNDTDTTELLHGQVLSIQIYLYFSEGWLVRVEDAVAVTETGVEVLSNSPKELADITILGNSTVVTAEIEVVDYEYGNETTINVYINDTENRTIDSVSFHDGNSWRNMLLVAGTNYSLQYTLDYTHSSFIPSLVRVTIDESAYYFDRELHATVAPSYNTDFEPPIRVVIENVATDTMMSWVFTLVGAEMLRVHFYNVYPPPGDQFLIRDVDGKVIFEYKWDLGAEAMSPWVPGNTLYVDVVPQWQSIYGGVNHFYFTIDEMGVFDAEYIPSTTTTPSPTTHSETTNTLTPPTSTKTTSIFEFDFNLVILAGFLCVSVALLLFYLKWRNQS